MALPVGPVRDVTMHDVEETVISSQPEALVLGRWSSNILRTFLEDNTSLTPDHITIGNRTGLRVCVGSFCIYAYTALIWVSTKVANPLYSPICPTWRNGGKDSQLGAGLRGRPAA
jgi:hypothetical protein